MRPMPGAVFSARSELWCPEERIHLGPQAREIAARWRGPPPPCRGFGPHGARLKLARRVVRLATSVNIEGGRPRIDALFLGNCPNLGAASMARTIEACLSIISEWFPGPQPRSRNARYPVPAREMAMKCLSVWTWLIQRLRIARIGRHTTDRVFIGQLDSRSPQCR